MGLGQKTGFDHVGVHPQLNLPRNSQDVPVGNAQVRSRLIDRIRVAGRGGMPGEQACEREDLLPAKPDKANTYGCDAGAVVDYRSIVRPWEQSRPSCEAKKPNSNN